MNSVQVIGHLGRDTTAIFGEGTQKRALFQVASNRKYTDKNGQKQEVVNWVPCIAWGPLADLMQNYGLKGRHIAVEGSLDCFQKPQKGDGTYDPQSVQVRCRNIQFLGYEDNVRNLVDANKAAGGLASGAAGGNEALANAIVAMLNAKAGGQPAAVTPPPPPPPQEPAANAGVTPDVLAALAAVLNPGAAPSPPIPTPEPAANAGVTPDALAALAAMLNPAAATPPVTPPPEPVAPEPTAAETAAAMLAKLVG
jgi:single-strand DNA-binding protein